MTLLNPTISLRRLCVSKDNRSVFDAFFHNGVNIIRGHNSSGKTTILDFIAYTLGAEYIPWKQEALLCDWSTGEILLNGKPVTIRREVNNKPLNPLFIFWGPYSDAEKAPFTSWEQYGFRRSASKLSFTQSILLALNLPEAQGDGASNLTMHQLLRVLYADQPSLHSPIFRNDTFDSALTRETVGGYLSGVYDDKLYSSQLEKRDLEKLAQQLEAELKSIFTVLAKSQQNINFESIGQEILNLEQKRDNSLSELSRLRRERTIIASSSTITGDTSLRERLDTVKKSLYVTQDKIAHYELDIADSHKFIEELEVRLKSLDESQTTRTYFGKLTFTFCPCCLNEVKQPATDSDECPLCKHTTTTSAADAQLLRMRNELRIQRQESLALIAEREDTLLKLKADIPARKLELRELEQRYSDTTQNWSSELETAIETSARTLGSIEQEIKGLYENQRLAETIHNLQERRDGIVGRISELESIIERLIFNQEIRKQKVQLEVSTTLGRLLRLDLSRQAEFQHAANVQFSFVDNTVSVEGSSQFSESSTVVLRHLFHLSLLSASTRIKEMRLPHFLILDGIEDGGMELERSHLLQEIIVSECNHFECDYQLIFATSQIAPSLDNDSYVVARQFSENCRSLEII